MPETIKPALDLAGREVILSFGLLGPGKGLELVLDALPAVVAARPTACYVVLGATHPNLLAAEGEAYRRSLEDRVARLGMGRHVRFVDRFVGRVELTRWLEGADVFVTPYPNLDQIVSGTLSYAMGAGRAIVSTPYAYASELLDDGRGLLVPPGSPAAWADALIGLLENDELPGCDRAASPRAQPGDGLVERGDPVPPPVRAVSPRAAGVPAPARVAVPRLPYAATARG